MDKVSIGIGELANSTVGPRNGYAIPIVSLAQIPTVTGNRLQSAISPVRNIN